MAGAIKREKYGGKVFPHADKTALLAEVRGTSSQSTQNVSNCKIITDSNDSKCRGGRKPIELDEFNQSLLRRVILGFYARQPAEIPTLDKITQEISSMLYFPKMSRETLRKWIQKVGFECKKRSKKWKLYEHMDVVAVQHRYL